QGEARFAAQIEMLKELEAMEMGHIIMIENIRKNGVQEEMIKRVPNLKISEYLSTEPKDLDLSYQSLLIRAMKREEASTKLYSEMSTKFPDPELCTLFRRLASEEASHKLRFETLYDEWMKDN
ncbi:MAG TPA: ferritin family protein, partial [Candidatus Cloacimonadota bacterium]|nr:ferritin family protein [Candidatus Cloacimonadota bacterium]